MLCRKLSLKLWIPASTLREARALSQILARPSAKVRTNKLMHLLVCTTTVLESVGEDDLLGARVITDVSRIEELLLCCNTQGCGSLCDVEKYRKGKNLLL